MTEQFIKKLNLIFLIAVTSIVLGISGCQLNLGGTSADTGNKPGPDEQTSADSLRSAEQIVRYTANFKPIYGVFGNVTNCHGFAWQCDTSIPMGKPNYTIDRSYVPVFWNDANPQYNLPANFYKVSSPVPGDRVVYGEGESARHSAVVYSTNPLMYISYCMSYQWPRIHRPDDPAGIYAYANDNRFGGVSAYYRAHREGGIPSMEGRVITCYYDGVIFRNEWGKKFAVEVDGTRYTAYTVENLSPNTIKFNYFWNINPLYYDVSSGTWKSAGNIYRTSNLNVPYDTIDMQTLRQTYFPNAAKLVVTVSLFLPGDTLFRMPKGYIQISRVLW
jgi:hypothetical protein